MATVLQSLICIQPCGCPVQTKDPHGCRLAGASAKKSHRKWRKEWYTSNERLSLIHI